ncbi:MAG: WD40 repeat domain-containing protein [Candidatus Eisenbacteria bacterium]
MTATATESDSAPQFESRSIDLAGPSALGVAFTADGLAIALGLSDGTLRILDGATLEPALEREGSAEWIRGIALTQERDRAATSGGDGVARIWDTGGWEILAELPYEAPILSVAFSPDGRFLATGAEDGAAIVWETKRGWLARGLGGREDSATVVAWSPVENVLATGSRDGKVRVFQLDVETPIAVPTMHDGFVEQLAFSPDGRLLASAGADGSIRIAIPTADHELAILDGHEGSVACLAFRPDGNGLVSGGSDRTVRSWDLASVIDAATLERESTNATMTEAESLGVAAPLELRESVVLATLGAPVASLAFDRPGVRLVATTLASEVRLLPSR